MSQFWNPLIHRLQPYLPGEQPKSAQNLIKLNTNEHPYPPSPKVLDAIFTELGADCDASSYTAAANKLRLYPDPDSSDLKQALATNANLQPQHVFVGNGSDEVLAHVFMALVKREANSPPLLLLDLGYSFYPTYAALFEIPVEYVSLANDFSIQIADFQRPCSAIVFANPNAPTGQLLPVNTIEKLLKMHPDAIVVIDEAYVDFSDDESGRIPSCASLIPNYPNLLVVQTFSKSRALAGLRVGYALGQPELIDALERVKNSFNSYPLDRLAQAGAVAALQDKSYFEDNRQRIIATRVQLITRITALGFQVIPSAANFIFTTHPEFDAAFLAAKLREQHIIVRHFTQPESIAQYLRISVGSAADCDALIEALHLICSTA